MDQNKLSDDDVHSHAERLIDKGYREGAFMLGMWAVLAAFFAYICVTTFKFNALIAASLTAILILLPLLPLLYRGVIRDLSLIHI